MHRLVLADVRWSGPGLHATFDLAGQRFLTSVWYADVDLDELERAIGSSAMECLAFHVAAFEINKLASLRPREISFGAYARFVSPRFVATWTEVLRKVWGEWRYVHDLPDWSGPEIVDPPVGSSVPATRVPRADGATLVSFGGGKDSVLAADLFERAGLPWSSSTYAHSVYGPPAPQMDLALRSLAPFAPIARHRTYVADTALAAPLVELLPARGARTFTAAETPSSVMESLPIVLAHGYTRLALAHEHSANRGNLIWDRTGEDVNHQWGKSFEAERMLAAYVAEELAPGLAFFSVLQPLSDVLIFELLREVGDAVVPAHSCNVQKPWCGRCAKCCYVALGYAAHLDGVYERALPFDVLDLPENDEHFAMLAGLGGHTPFECVGEVDETRLALALCAARGRDARAIRMFRDRIGAIELPATLARHAVVHGPHAIPSELARAMLPRFERAAAAAERRIRSLLER